MTSQKIRIEKIMPATGVIIFFTCSILFVLSIKFLAPESYFILNPAIDTMFTNGYNEEGFDEIQAGMAQNDVELLLGKPFARRHIVVDTQGGLKKRQIVWEYTRDGASSWWDFAWLGREIIFTTEGFVVRTKKTIYYH